MKTWLVLDVHYLCHRAFHSSKELSFRGQSTGAIFGFLKTISALKDEFQTDDVAFCFEHPHLFRRDIFPEYKANRKRKKRTDKEIRLYKDLQIQIAELKNRYLPKIGFRNIFCFRGMESDDIMAAIAANSTDNIILVTSDSDLFQCLREDVSIYSPQKQKLLTEQWFRRQHRISPSSWSLVKAIAGCHGDGVPGVGGVGEASALSFLAHNEITEGRRMRILSKEGRAIIRRNKALVKLPFEGCPSPVLKSPDRITKHSWIQVCHELGMRSIASRPPIATRKLK